MGMTGRGIPMSLLANAQGVAIVPDLLKGGTIVGVRHGRGVLLVRDETGTWQPPRFILDQRRQRRLPSGGPGDRPGVGLQDQP